MFVSRYLVSRNGETLGPWAIEMIAQKLAMAELAVTDFAWDEKANDWVTLMEFGELKSHLHSRKPKAPAPRVLPAERNSMEERNPMEELNPPATESMETLAKPALVLEPEAIQEEWYVSRGQQKFGPFSYLDLIKALQDKSVFEFDYIWAAGMDNWVRIAEHEKFATETIRSLLKNLTNSREQVEVFAKRKHPRLSLENDVLVHDNSSVSPGRMVEASVGGLGLIVKNSTLVPGEAVNVHFASMQGLPAFNAIGEVVSKKFVRSARDRRAPIKYGIRFLKMDAAAEIRVKNFFKEKTGRAAV